MIDVCRSASQVALLKKVLTKFCQLHIRQGMKAWKAKAWAKNSQTKDVHHYQIALGHQSDQLRFRRWPGIAVKDKNSAGQLKMERLKERDCRSGRTSRNHTQGRGSPR